MVEPGCQFVNPLTDEIKYVVNTRGENLLLEQIVAQTSDKVEIMVDGLIQIKVEDPEKAIFQVTNATSAIKMFASSSLRTIIGKLSFDELNSSKDAVSKAVKNDLKKPLKGWGINMNGFSIKSLKPVNKKIVEVMKSQIDAEQNQKGTEKKADSDKMVKENKAKADRYEKEKEADGKARYILSEAHGTSSAVVKSAQGMAESMQVLIDKASSEGGLEVLKLRIKQEYIDSMKNLSNSKSNNTCLGQDFTDITNFID